MRGLPLHDYAGLPPAHRDFVAATFGGFTALDQVLAWGRSVEPPVTVTDVIAQDEYTHDALVPLPDGTWLSFDTT